MAINKRKVLDAARKHAQKGAKQKALKEYNKLVQADPRDAKLLLEIGDVYRRWGQTEEAIAQYTKVANQYKQDGFDARAVAVLKQILNLDPKRYTAHVTLAELYQRMGLDSDAVAALRTAADGYYREGRRKEALELLRKMAALDPSNTTSRLKVADLLQQEGMNDDAVAEYREIVEELGRQGAGEQVCVVLERLLELRPDDVEAMAGLARQLSDLGRPERAEPFAVRALEQVHEPDYFELLCGIYKSLGNDAKLAETTRELANYYKGRGEEDRAREVLQRLPPALMEAPEAAAADPVAAPAPAIDRSEVEESEVEEEELLDDEDFLVTDATDQSDIEPPPADVDSAPGDEEIPDDELPEGDPEQLLAEANVYLRYGKRAQAIASLRSALLQEPEHRAALEKLGDAYAEDDRADDAIGCWQRAAELARAAGDADVFSVLRDRIGNLDPAAASEISPMDEAPSAEPDLADASDVSDLSDAEDDGVEFELDIDVSETEDVDEADASDEAAFLADAPQEGDGLEIVLDGEDDEVVAAGSHEISLDDEEFGDDDFEVEVDVGADVSETAEEEVEFDISEDEPVELGGEPEPEPEVDFSEDEEIEFASDEGDADASIVLDDPTDDIEIDAGTDDAAGSTSERFGQSTTTAAQVNDDLEEADFYIQQGLQDEAEGIYRRILAVAPNHPTALLKLGELVANRGEDPGTVTDSGLETTPARDDAVRFDDVVSSDEADDASEEISFEVGDQSETDDAFAIETEETESDLFADEPSAAPPAEAPPELSDDLAAVLAEAEASVTDDAAAESPSDPGEDTQRELSLDLEGEAEMGDPLGDDATEVERVAAQAAEDDGFTKEPVQAEPEPDSDRSLADDTLPLSEEAPAAAGGFDLAAELADVFEDANQPSPGEITDAGQSTVEDGFESIFADFKKGVSATLDDGDYDTRFDLGIAYREMGLFDDAISEFSVCLGSPTRRVESLHMMAICALELGRAGDAVNHLEQALSSSDLPDDRQVGLRFDLGRAHRASGNLQAAREALQIVQQLDAAFPGLADELAAVESGSTETASDDDGFESFDDIMGDFDDDEPPPAAEPVTEQFENFDDVITDVEAEVIDEPVDTEPIMESEPIADAEPEPEADNATTRTGRKKKKISFV